MYYTEEQVNALARYLSKHGYTDGVDVNPEISLTEYGILRNPQTGYVVYAREVGSGGYCLDWSRVNLDNVRQELTDMTGGFFSFIGEEKAAAIARLDNAYLANDISSMNDYNDLFDQSCNWDATIETIKSQVRE